MFHKLLLRLSVNFMAVLMIVLLVLGALVSRFMGARDRDLRWRARCTKTVLCSFSMNRRQPWTPLQR